MKQVKNNIRRVCIFLCILFVLLAVYGGYSITVNGNRWFSSGANTFVRSKKKDVIAGNILDRNGEFLAFNEVQTTADALVIGDHTAAVLCHRHVEVAAQQNLLAGYVDVANGFLVVIHGGSSIKIVVEAMVENRNTNTKHIRDIVAQYKDGYFCEVEKKLIKTGFYKLDDALGGLEGGDVTIIAARPSVGKSAFVTQLIGFVASKFARVGYFNLEMNENQVYERFVARMSKLSLTRVRRAKQFLGGEEEAFEKANEVLSNYDVVVSTGSKSVREIKSDCRHMKFDLIVIDYLQLIKADKSFANRASEVGEVSKAIKGLAMELNVPIILLSQLSRAVESRDSKEPQLSDLRESGDIEQDASNVIFLWNLSDDKRCKGMSVAKNRQGELTKIGLEFDGEHMEFRERQEEFYQWQKTVKNGEKMREQMAENNPFDDWR